MKQTIDLGAYGWLHAHWISSFYPDDLPADWRLGYYSNEFNAVLVPAEYWQSIQIDDCKSWLEDVHPDFRFFIECDSRMLETIPPADLTAALKQLQPQLSALVFTDAQSMPETLKCQFYRLADHLAIGVISSRRDAGTETLWQPGSDPAAKSAVPVYSRFAFVEDDLTDLRSVVKLIRPFTELLTGDEAYPEAATMIVHHPQLQAANLAKFRSVLELMGH